MTDKIMTYYSQTYGSEGTAKEIHYFPTQRKLEKFVKGHEGTGQWAQHEIPVSVAKELIKLSKKKLKEKCPECGK